MKRKEYLFSPTQAKLVILDGQCFGLPGWCNHISVPISRHQAAQALWDNRHRAKRLK